MAELGPLKADPDELVLSFEGAERTVLGIAQNHLDASLQEPLPRDGWKKVRRQLDDLHQAAEKLHQTLGSTYWLTAMALLRTGAQMNTRDLLQRLEQIQREAANALAIVPENNMGDAVTALGRLGTANEILVLGCQNLLFACGHTAVGATPAGRLEHVATLVKRLALGSTCPIAGIISGAMRSPKVKGRSKSQILKIEAFDLVLGDAMRRRGPDSELVKKAEDRASALRSVIPTPVK